MLHKEELFLYFQQNFLINDPLLVSCVKVLGFVEFIDSLQD